VSLSLPSLQLLDVSRRLTPLLSGYQIISADDWTIAIQARSSHSVPWLDNLPLAIACPFCYPIAEMVVRAAMRANPS
jgi:hypothetical protein